MTRLQAMRQHLLFHHITVLFTATQKSLCHPHFHLLATAFHAELGLIRTQRSPGKRADLKTKQNTILTLSVSF